MDRSINHAIEVGQRNADSVALVTNWCAHVRIERMGGRGMVEAATGLPIGHHGLACDHAPAGGVMCWETRDAALDFYDRNCKGCALRKPVAIPNLSVWVGERDAAVAKRNAAEDAAEAERAAALAERQTARRALRVGLSPAAADIVDQIDELDLEGTPELTRQLVETARLAPEAFAPSVIDHIFELLEGRHGGFETAGLQALAAVGADPARLARCAMLSLEGWAAVDAAVRVLLPRLDAGDPSLIAALLPTLIDYAAPSREAFVERPRPRIAPLILVNRAYSAAVAAALDTLLGGGPVEAGLAARGLTVLARRDSALVTRFARPLVSKYLRAPWMPDPGDLEQDAASAAATDLRHAVVEFFLRAPELMDDLLQKFRAGATPAAETRIMSAYSRVLFAGRFRRTRRVSDADRLAFRRMIWAATELTNHKAMGEIHGVIRQEPDELLPLAQENVDQLLGAAVLMDARLVAHDNAVPEPGAPGWTVWERVGDRQLLYGLRGTFVAWAAAGAAANGTPRAYLDMLDNLGEEADSLAACLIEHSVALIDSAEALNAVLPTLYRALVGASVQRRGDAVAALSEIPHLQLRNAPDLLFEAFLTCLTDPYIYVHTQAVRTLSRISVPKSYSVRVRDGLIAVLRGHERNPNSLALVLDTIEELTDHLTEAQLAGPFGAGLVKLLAKAPTWQLGSEIRWYARSLARAEGLVDLLIRMMTDPEGSEHTEEAVLDAIAALPDEVIYAHGAALAAVPIGADWPQRFRMFGLVEVLSRCGAWAEAEQAAAAAVAATPDTVREAAVRLSFQLLQAAAAFENAQAQGDAARAAEMAAEWRKVKAAKEAHDREIAQRPDPFRDLSHAS